MYPRKVKHKKTPRKEQQNQHQKIPKNAQKAYKLLALQENISNNVAKSLIDKGLVSVKGKKIQIAERIAYPEEHTFLSFSPFKVLKKFFVMKIF